MTPRPAHSSVLWLDRPAPRWLDAFPLGNGRLGAMVFGGTVDERIALNHENLWRGVLRDPRLPDAAPHLSKIREAFFSGDMLRGAELANRYLGGPDWTPGVLDHVQPFQPFGDLRLHLDLSSDCTEYRRELDLRDGIARTSFQAGSCRIVRRVIVSAVDQVIAVEVQSSQPLSGWCALDRIEDPDARVEGWTRQDRFGFAARFVEEIRFAAHGRVLTDSTAIRSGEKGMVRFEGARAITILLALATDYHGESPEQVCARTLDRAPGDFSRILSRHLSEHRPLFDRVELHLPGPEGDLPTDKRIAALRAGIGDPSLFALYFNYGRYLLLSSSRDCEQPANLQGVWNEDLRPPWDSDFHSDVNLQMNYWPAEVCALPECTAPLFTFLERAAPGCREAAARYFGCRGLFYQSGDIWKMNWMSAKGWDVWTGGAAWFAQHFWWRWLHSKDVDFLRDHAYPFIKEVAAFYEDFLVDDGLGRLVTVPSQSPENRFVGGSEPVSLCIGATMDYLLIREVLGNAIEAARILKVDEGLHAKWESILTRIPEFRVGRHGQLQEWQEDYEEVEPGHRHVSHLYGVHPGNLMTPNRLAEFYRAARVSLERRMTEGGGHTGWSRAWVCCLWARFAEAQLALDHLTHLLTDFSTESLLDTHPLPNCAVFQIDGNFGGTAAIAELLVQSHDGYVRLLPALPSSWDRGSVRGLRTVGGFEVAIDWEGSVLRRATLRAHVDEEVKLEPPTGSWIVRRGSTCSRAADNLAVSLHIPRGEEAEIFAEGNGAPGHAG